MRRHPGILAIGVLLLQARGGGDDGGPAGPNPNQSGARTMSARIDGAAWSTTSVGVSTTNSLLILAGSNGTQTIGFGVAMTQGTHTIGPSSAATANVMIGQQTWNATSFQGSGSIIITTLTANRAVGTFSFTANAVTSGASPATRQITNGQFDVTF
jgi:hypothetical protein